MARVQELAPRLALNEAQAALSTVLSTMPKIIDDDAREALALAAQEFASALAADKRHAQAALDPILDAIKANTSLRSANSEVNTARSLVPLLQAIQELAPQLTPDQARATLAPVLEPARDMGSTSGHSLLATAATVRALPGQPDARQMQGAL